MILKLDSEDEMFAKEYIPQVLKAYITKYYRQIKASSLNEHLKSLNVNYTVKAILLFVIETMKLSKKENEYVLEVDKNRILPNTLYNLDTLIKLINYGTLQVKGYNLLVKSFEYVEKRLSTLKRLHATKKVRENINTWQ
jgi:hypothetical protein